jgi:hypothetical protein
LVALEKVVEQQAVEWIRMESFDWGKTLDDQAKNMAAQCMDQALLMTHDSANHVAVQCLESTMEAKPNKCDMRVVALKDFGPGGLMLTPYCGKDHERSLARLSPTEPEAEKNDYIARMHITVSTNEVRKRKSPEAPESTDDNSMRARFVVQSPLPKLQTTTNTFDELYPIWVLPKTKVAKNVNMELGWVVFDYSPMAPRGTKVPSPLSKPLFIIKMQVVVNNRKIKKGERLCLSMIETTVLSSDDEGDREK